jgi:hypothetical protein
MAQRALLTFMSLSRGVRVLWFFAMFAALGIVIRLAH